MRRKRKRRPRGTGSIYKRKDGRWCGEIHLGYDLGGKRRPIYAYGKSPAEAQAALTEEIARYRRGERPAGPYTHETVSAFLDRWIVDGCHAAEPSKANYRASMARIKDAIGKMRLDRVTAQTIDVYIATQAQNGLGARSLLGDWMTLHAAFGCALRWEPIARNPVGATQRPAYAPAERQGLTIELAQTFVAKATQDRLGALWILSLGTGMRPSEVCRIQRDRVDLTARTVTVARSKTQAGARTLPLPAFVVDALREHQKTLLACGLAASTSLFPRGLAQIRKRKNRLDQMDRFTVRDLWETFRKTLGDAVPDGFAFKDLRHAYSSLLKVVGAHPHDHRVLMGHSSYEITSRVYTHDIDDAQRAIADRLDTMLRPNQTEGDKIGSQD